MKSAYQYFQNTLQGLKEEGLYKNERVITTPQSAHIDTPVKKDVINMCDDSGIETGIDVHKVMAASKKLMSVMEIVPDSYVLRAGPTGDLIKASQEK